MEMCLGNAIAVCVYYGLSLESGQRLILLAEIPHFFLWLKVP